MPHRARLLASAAAVAAPWLLGSLLLAPLLTAGALAQPAGPQNRAAPPAAAPPPAAPPPLPGAAPAQDGAIASLLEQANYWRLQNRPELVLRTMERVLAADPRNLDALAGAAQAQAELGNRTAAESYVARLRQVAPNDPRLTQTDITVRATTVDQGALAEARRLGQAGRAAEAAQRYQQLFRGAQPPDAYALEYYQTVAGTEQGYIEGRDGLGRLAIRAPNDNRVQLAYAQTLTYRDETRGEGISRLRRLAQNPDIANTAITGWRQALLWSGPNRNLVPELEAFLQRFPNDTMVAQRLEESRNPPAGADEASLGRMRGFEQFNAGRIADAQREFEAAIAANANDADATGGLGLVRLRQGRFADARRLLEQAIRLAPDKREQWQRALDGAAYAQELASARAALQAGNLDAAEQNLRSAIGRQAADRADAEALLGDLALRRGDLAGAEQRYRSALSRRPNLGAAASGLYEVLQQQGRFAEAEELQRRLGGLFGGGNDATPNVRQAYALRAEAQRAADPATAAGLLQQALQIDPNNPWIRLDLARLLARSGRVQDARRVAEGPAQAGGNPDALYAAALFADEDNRPRDAAGYINSIPVRLRNADMNRLLARTRVAQEVQTAADMWRTNRRPEARAALYAIAARPDPTGNAGALAVRALGILNDREAAAEAARTALAANPTAPAAARLAIAGALLTAGADQDAIALARAVEASPNLTGEDRRQASALQAGLAIRVSDRLTERGDPAAAYDALAPALARNPTDPAANLALARIYQGAGQPREAAQITEGVLARDPRSLDARFAAVESAISNREWGRAEAMLVEARALNPNDPRVPLLEARLARAWGNSGRALRALELAAERRRAEAYADPTLGGVVQAGDVAADYDNPFRRVSRAGASGGPLGLPNDPLSNQIARELSAVREETAARLQGGMGFRSRTGTNGLDRLEEYSAPIDASVGAGRLGGRFTLTATPTNINSGQLDTTNVSTLRSYGSNALAQDLRQNNFNQSTQLTQVVRDRYAARDTNATGTALGLAYTRGAFSGDVGTSPIGFRHMNILGGIEIAPAITNNFRVRLIAEQRSVTDSLLSWSGARDPNSARSWGGVVRSGGRGQLEYVTGPVGVYLGAGYSVLTGDNVARNNRYEAGAGASYTVWRRPDEELLLGLDLVYFSYRTNQRLFTFGNGGYFSPQSYFAVNIPIDWRGRSGNFAYHLGATIGYQSYREDAAKFFPTDPAAQAQLEAVLAQDTTARSVQPARNESGIVGGLRGDVEYSVTPNLRIGALLRYDRSQNWSEARGLMFARYRFDR